MNASVPRGISGTLCYLVLKNQISQPMLLTVQKNKVDNGVFVQALIYNGELKTDSH